MSFEKQTPESQIVSRRTALKGLLGVGALVGLDACGIPNLPGLPHQEKQTSLSPEQRLERDFETYMRQLGNGIIEQLATSPDTKYDAPHIMRDVNTPGDYYWRQWVDNDSTRVPGVWKDPELSVSLENTQNVSYQPDGYHVEMTVSSPTSNGEDGHFVIVDARPALDSAKTIEAMLAEGRTVLEIATEIMSAPEGVKVETSVMYCKDDHTPGYEPYVGGKDLPFMDSADFREASLDGKRQTYENYKRAVEPLKRLAGIT